MQFGPGLDDEPAVLLLLVGALEYRRDLLLGLLQVQLDAQVRLHSRVGHPVAVADVLILADEVEVPRLGGLQLELVVDGVILVDIGDVADHLLLLLDTVAGDADLLHDLALVVLRQEACKYLQLLLEYQETGGLAEVDGPPVLEELKYLLRLQVVFIPQIHQQHML